MPKTNPVQVLVRPYREDTKICFSRKAIESSIDAGWIHYRPDDHWEIEVTYNQQEAYRDLCCRIRSLEARLELIRSCISCGEEIKLSWLLCGVEGMAYMTSKGPDWFTMQSDQFTIHEQFTKASA